MALGSGWSHVGDRKLSDKMEGGETTCKPLGHTSSAVCMVLLGEHFICFLRPLKSTFRAMPLLSVERDALFLTGGPGNSTCDTF